MPKFAPDLLPHAVRDAFKWEIAQEIGIADDVIRNGWPDTTSRDCGRVGGKIGGNMVKVMIKYAEQALADGADPSGL